MLLNCGKSPVTLREAKKSPRFGCDREKKGGGGTAGILHSYPATLSNTIGTGSGDWGRDKVTHRLGVFSQGHSLSNIIGTGPGDLGRDKVTHRLGVYSQGHSLSNIIGTGSGYWGRDKVTHPAGCLQSGPLS